MKKKLQTKINERVPQISKQQETLDRPITMEELVDAAFALKSNTASGRDSILSRDIIELLDTRKASEKWKNVEILKFCKMPTVC